MNAPAVSGESWADMAELAAWILSDGPWIVGDWLAAAPDHDELVVWLERNKAVPVKTAADLLITAERVSVSERRPDVGWPQHHATIRLDKRTRRRVLEQAAAAELSEREVIRLVRSVTDKRKDTKQ